MTRNAGVLRSVGSLGEAATEADRALAVLGGEDSVAASEARNVATVARALAATAMQREESRGAHTRTDFPDLSADLEIRIVVV
jgi:aspartate oxidase